VVTAENGWCSVHLTLAPDADEPAGDAPWLASFGGGAFISQIPEDARAVVRRPTAEVEAALAKATEGVDGVDFDFAWNEEERGRDLVVTARGASAHSSKPWDGKNGITHLSRVLGAVEWRDSQAARMVRLINDLVGIGDYGTRFGDVAYEHPFMGRLTLALTTLDTTEDGGPLTAGINIRQPVGRSAEEMEDAIRSGVASWQEASGVEVEVVTAIYNPYLIENATHVSVLLDVFRRHTSQEVAGPISIGGGTHARLLPNGVNFGPGMPGEPYTGHSEHEYTTRDQMVLNLGMYTAMLVELATAP
jgi:dipeptidase D